jgi:hypothetical protein
VHLRVHPQFVAAARRETLALDIACCGDARGDLAAA